MKKTILILFGLLGVFSLKAQIDYTKPVGATAGQFEVSLTGAATYTVPIYIPPGSNGMQPNVSLVYNSQGGLGCMGLGWEISGVSVITRVHKNYYHDGKVEGYKFDESDHYALDGQRLIAVNGTNGAEGTEYRTENESFVRVFSYGPTGWPIRFVVYTKDGKTIEYSKRKIVPGGGGEPIAWYVNKITDEYGNYMICEYIEDFNSGVRTGTYYNGDFLLKAVSYTGNENKALQPYNRIEFSYDTYDFYPAYSFGVFYKVFKNRLRLNKINCYSDGQLARSYWLGYSSNTFAFQFYLHSIKESNGENQSYNETIFTWEETPGSYYEGGNNISYFGRTASNFQSSSTRLLRMIGDIDGDGISDVVSTNSSEESTLYPKKYPYKIGEIGVAGRVDFLVTHQQTSIFLSDGMLFDIDGDGKDELVAIVQRGYTYVSAYKFNGTDFGNRVDLYNITSFEKMLAFGCGYAKNQISVQFGDFNGDGLPDMMVYDFTTAHVYLNNGSCNFSYGYSLSWEMKKENTQYRLTDVNGDGMTDFIAFDDGKVWVFLSTGSSFIDHGYRLENAFTEKEGWTLKGNEIHMLDVNGDGLPDIVGTTGCSIVVSLCNGGGYENWTIWAYTGRNDTEEMIKREPIRFLDINGDGLLDFVHFTSLGTRFYINTGGSFSTSLNMFTLGLFSYINGWDEGSLLRTFGDFNGDGIADMIGFGHDEISIAYGTNGNLHKKIKQIKDGMQNGVNIKYAYQRPNATLQPMNYPYSSKIAPTLPVSEVRLFSSNPNIGEYAKESYSFQSPLTHLRGKGFLGFQKFEKTDLIYPAKETRLFTQSFINQNYLYLLPSSITVDDLLEGKKVKTEYTYNISAYTDKRFWLKTNKEKVTYEANDTRTETTFGYDNNGNVSEQITKVFSFAGSSMAAHVNTVRSAYVNTGFWNFKPSSVEEIKTSEEGNYTRRINMEYGEYFQRVSESHNNDLLEKTLTYDDFGNVSSIETKAVPAGGTAESRTQTYVYDPKGRFLTQTTNALGHAIKYQNDGWGNLTKITDENDFETFFQYDGWGNLKETIYPDGTVSEQSVAWAQNTLIPNALYYTISGGTAQMPAYVFYDALGREACSYTGSDFSGAENVYVDTRYDDVGRLTKKSLPYASIDTPDEAKDWIQFGYMHKKLASERGYRLNKTYSYETRQVNTRDNLNNGGMQYTKKYDVLGRLSESIDPGGKVSYTYNSRSLPIKIENAGAKTFIEYDAWGNRSSITEPNAGTIISWHNLFGELIKQKDAGGNITTFAYDKLGRMTQKIINGNANAEGSATYAYDQGNKARGKISSVSSTNHTTQYAYDNNGRLSEQTETLFSIPYQTAYTYNSQGKLSRLHYPGGYSVKYEYNAHGELTAVKDAQDEDLWRPEVKNRYGQTVSCTWGNGKISYYGYDDHGNLTLIQTGNPGPPLPPVIVPLSGNLSLQGGDLNMQSTQNSAEGPGITDRPGTTGSISICDASLQFLEYEYDDRGLLSKNICRTTGQTEEYRYDHLNRLSHVNNTGGFSDRISYADKGNIAGRSSLGPWSYKFGEKPHAVTKAGSVVGYGNSYPVVQCQTDYTPFSKIQEISEEDKSLSFYYGHDQQRIRTIAKINGEPTKTTTFVNSFYEEETTGNTTRQLHYIRAGGKLIGIHVKTGETDNMYYVYTDRLGSYHVITDETGSELERLSFDPWGLRRNSGDWGKEEAAGTNHLFSRGFTGHEHLDDYKTINMNGRLYDPVIATFFSPDPYVADATSTQDFNRYSYARNNPLMYTDPTGEWIHLVVGGIFGGIANLAANHDNVHNFWQGLGYFSIGGLAGSASAGIGSGVNSMFLAGGSFGAGFLGTSTAGVATGFWAGAVSAGASGFAGGFAGGFGNGLMQKQNFGDAIWSGTKAGLIAGGYGFVIGGLTGGIAGKIQKRSFWNGVEISYKTKLEQNIPDVLQDGDANCLAGSAQSIDESFGGDLTQEQLRNWVAPGTDKNKHFLPDKAVWEIYAKKRGYNYGGEIITNDVLKDVEHFMRNDVRMSFTYDNGRGNHSVVLQGIIEKTVIRQNGTSSTYLIYRLMDPALGETFNLKATHFIGGHIFYIWR